MKPAESRPPSAYPGNPQSWQQLLARPERALILVLLGLWLWAALSPGFHLRQVKDSLSYLKAAELSGWVPVLSSVRTLGYPLLLRGLQHLSPNLAVLPLLQLALLLAAILVYRHALARCGLAPWLTVAAALPLALGPMGWRFPQLLLAESVAVSCALLAMSCLLALVAGARDAGWWLGLAGATFWCYQTRPAFLFLVAWVPVAGLALRWQLEGRGSGWLRRRSFGLGLAAASVLPFLLFCTLRWAVVGHFGLVSFGGFNTIGIAAPLLEPSLVAELPPARRPLAAAIIDRQRAEGVEPLAQLAGHSWWQRLRHWQDTYNPNIWRVAVPAGEQLLGSAEGERNEVALNRDLAALAAAVLARRPGAYLQWIAFNLAWGVAYTTLRLLWLPLLALALAAGWSWSRRPAGGWRPALRELPWRQLLLPLHLAGSFFLAGLLLVVLVEPAEERYLIQLSFLAAGALVVPLVSLLGQAAQPRKA